MTMWIVLLICVNFAELTQESLSTIYALENEKSRNKPFSGKKAEVDFDFENIFIKTEVGWNYLQFKVLPLM